MSELLETYIEELGQDTELEAFTLTDKQMKLPGIKHKWAGRLIRHKFNINKLKNEVDTVISKGILEAKQTATIAINDSTARTSVMKTPMVKDFYRRINEEELIVEFLEKIDKVFNSMTFDIKNLIELQKLEQL